MKKSRITRLTITLHEEVLSQVDRLIDGENLRSRSHAIEYLVRQSLSPDVRSAVILAGGKGRGGRPPVLTDIDGQPLITITLSHLDKFGVKDFIICGGSWERQIRTLLDKSDFAVHYVSETQELGTAGAIKKASEFLLGNRFLVLHGDTLTTLDFYDFIRFHEHEGSLATIAVKPRIAEEKYGKVLLEGNKITDYLNRSGDRGISIVNTGIYLFEPGVLALIPNQRPASLEAEVFPKLAAMGELSAFIFQGIWFDVSRIKDRKQALLRWRSERR